MTRAIDVAIIGGGIIGTTLALALANEGRAVVVFDPCGAGAGTASGSASIISPSEIFPLAHPSLLAALPKMLLDPLGPLAVRPQHLVSLLPWGLRFLAAMHPTRYSRACAALADLNRNAMKALHEFAETAGAGPLLRQDGIFVVARTAATFAELQRQACALQAAALSARIVDGAALRSLEPALSAGFAGALFVPGAGHILDPSEFGVRIAARAVERGAKTRNERVTALALQPDGSWAVSADLPWRARRVVVASGVWSDALLRPLGYRVPIETERGYHLTLPSPGIRISRPLIFADRHFCATPLSSGLRLAGTVEFAGTHAPMNPRRSDILFELGQSYLPGVRRDGASRWMGFRPSFPDSLPAIGASIRHRNLFYSFGHQHLGLTQAGISARALADLVMGRKPSFDLSPFSIERFSHL